MAVIEILGIATGIALSTVLLYGVISALVFIIRKHSLCTNCGKEITKKEAKQFDNQCEGCWFEMCQERTLNEDVER